jgi:hypothetical protein
MTSAFPKSETYGLAAQARRAAVSVPANIAEGFKKRGRLDKARFMNIAQGSLEESRYYLILARDLGYVDPLAAFDCPRSNSEPSVSTVSCAPPAHPCRPRRIFQSARKRGTKRRE